MKRAAYKKAKFTVGPSLRWVHPLVGLSLLPVLAGAWMAVWRAAQGLAGRWTLLWPLVAGVAAYVLFQFLFKKPMGVYVFGHEVTHALAAYLSGYRVKSLRVSAKGGEVLLSDTNVLVALAPYIFPFYTVAALVAFRALQSFGAISPGWGAFLAGFTFSFHVALTAYALRQRQPDLNHVGPFLSLVLIFLANGLALILLLKILYPSLVSIKIFGFHWWRDAVFLWKKVLDYGAWAFQKGLLYMETR